MVSQELLRAVVGLELQALMLVAAPVTTALVGWGVRQLALHVRDRRVIGYAARLVAWAEQTIPVASNRYGQVASLLSKRYPFLGGEQLEVLIESEVLGLKTGLKQASGALAAAAVAPTGASSPEAVDSGVAVQAAVAVAAQTTPMPVG